ncbi:Hypothetical predicted protein [Olea europaea subsp. europaea]|uniref:Uncharacterized protein n=1 Tax=Olea europaea subsp. europaea TaxID=158383 RepID=A0A8S0SR98_OLEEU|nr:Hypothetical predicted protein [Olea europaea subsp. europaea]
MPPQIHDKQQSNSDVSTTSLGTVAMGGTGRDLEWRLSSGVIAAHRLSHRQLVQRQRRLRCPLKQLHSRSPKFEKERGREGQ